MLLTGQEKGTIHTQRRDKQKSIATATRHETRRNGGGFLVQPSHFRFISVMMLVAAQILNCASFLNEVENIF